MRCQWHPDGELGAGGSQQSGWASVYRVFGSRLSEETDRSSQCAAPRWTGLVVGQRCAIGHPYHRGRPEAKRVKLPSFGGANDSLGDE